MVRGRAVYALGEVRDGKLVVPPLLKALQDPSAKVRAVAAQGLGYQDKDAVCAIPALTRALLDPEESVRETAKRALARIKEDDMRKGKDR